MIAFDDEPDTMVVDADAIAWDDARGVDSALRPATCEPSPDEHCIATVSMDAVRMFALGQQLRALARTAPHPSAAEETRSAGEQMVAAARLALSQRNKLTADTRTA